MLKYAVIALIAAVSAVGAAETFGALDAVAHAPQPTAMTATTTTELAPAVPGEAAAITKAKDGHYWAEAMVDGHQVRFLVDTGATTVALTTEDARRLGIDPKTLDYNYSVTTASGQARAASVKLASVSVAGARVADVDALVIEKGLETSLLGMTYLGRLSRFEATRTALILRP
jgi:aspartyl protease family protein